MQAKLLRENTKHHVIREYLHQKQLAALGERVSRFGEGLPAFDLPPRLARGVGN
jgi:hypothetical protein